MGTATDTEEKRRSDETLQMIFWKLNSKLWKGKEERDLEIGHWKVQNKCLIFGYYLYIAGNKQVDEDIQGKDFGNIERLLLKPH